MKILFDCRCCQVYKQRGIDNYFQDLIAALIIYGGVQSTILYSRNLPAPSFKAIVEDNSEFLVLEDFDQIEHKSWDYLFKGAFFDVSIMECYPSDILRCCKDVVGVLYDLIPLLFPKDYLNSIELKRLYAGQIEALKYSSHLFCISEQTKLDAIKFLGLPDSKLSVVYCPIFQNDNQSIERSDFLRSKHCVAVLGNDRRKGYLNLSRAFLFAKKNKLIPTDSKLYIVCAGKEDIEADISNNLKVPLNELSNEIHVTGFINEVEKKKLIGTACCTIFPSFYEGWGLPILESYLQKTPVIASFNSSIKELIPKNCGFDPHDVESMVEALVKIFSDPNLREESVEFGAKILRMFEPSLFVKKIINRLHWLQEQTKKHSEMSDKCAVFAVLPPAKTGIAPYSYKVHLRYGKEAWDVFAPNLTAHSFQSRFCGFRNVFPITFYNIADYRMNYFAKLFILGNSFHHLPVLQKAIQTRGVPNRALYLHEAYLFNLFSSLYSSYKGIKNLLTDWYPSISNEIEDLTDTDQFCTVLHKHSVYMLRPLVYLTGINHIIVNNQRCKRMVLSEFSAEEQLKIKVDVLYHPIESLYPTQILNLKDSNYSYVVGSFGIPSTQKFSKEILDAVEFLNNKGLRVKLIFAGYATRGSYVDIGKDFVTIIDSPDEQTLINLMASVDLAVQLRCKENNGESSGCIAQLLGIGQKLLTTKNFVDEEMEKYCNICTTEECQSISQLALQIEKSLLKSVTYKKEDLVQFFSYEKLSNLLFRLITNNL